MGNSRGWVGMCSSPVVNTDPPFYPLFYNRLQIVPPQMQHLSIVDA